MHNILEFPGTAKKKSCNSMPTIKLYKCPLFYAFNLSNYLESR